MPGGFQTQVYNQEAQAVAGDRASQNAIATFLAGPGGLVADSGGIIIGNFAWVTPPTDPDGTNSLATQVNGGGAVAGFAYNWTQGLNTVFLSDASLLIPQGLPVALATRGDFWAINAGAGAVSPGMKAYANFGTGAATFAATGSPTLASAASASSIANATGISATASFQNDIMNVSAVSAGTIVRGATILGTGLTGSPQVTSQLSGTPGGAGVYTISPSQQKSIASEAITGTYGVMTVGTMTTGTGFSVGQTLQATGAVVAGTQITQLLTGTGGNGSTFAVNNNTVVSSQVINANGNVETNWVAASAGVPGALVKMTTWQP